MLHATDRHATGTNTGVALAILYNRSRWWYSCSEMIQNVSIGSGIDADYTEKRKLQF